jgi:tetratricopeptide (TPR) repeat protein
LDPETKISPFVDPEPILVDSAKDEALNNAIELPECARAFRTRMDIVQDLRPFDWSSVDIPGSPGLSRLFKGLEIDSAHIAPMSLDEIAFDDSSCISNKEVLEVVRSKNMTTREELLLACSSESSQMQSYCTALEEVPTSQYPHFPWRNIEGVFCGYTSSPLTEIYVFPPSPPQNHGRKSLSPKITLWADLQKQEKELRIKFEKLKEHLPEDHPALPAAMEELAKVLDELSKDKDAESIRWKLVRVYQRLLGPDHLTTLWAWQNLICLLGDQGEYFHVRVLNDDLRSRVCRLLEPHHPLALRCVETDAWLAEGFGRREECENLTRKFLQITLAAYGPKDISTRRAITKLGSALCRTGKKCGHGLVRIAMQLSLEVVKDDVQLSRQMELLIGTLHKTGAHEESYNFATKALERFRPLLGPKHRSILSFEEMRARSMLEIGKLVESESVFRRLLSLYSNGEIEPNRRTMENLWAGMANALSEMGSIEEATTLYEKCFQAKLSVNQPCRPTSMTICFRLANCYEGQGRPGDALRVYHQMLNKLIGSSQSRINQITLIESQICRIDHRLHLFSESGSKVANINPTQRTTSEYIIG